MTKTPSPQPAKRIPKAVGVPAEGGESAPARASAAKPADSAHAMKAVVGAKAAAKGTAGAKRAAKAVADAKPAAKAVADAKPAAKSTQGASVAADKPAKAHKPKLVRDSFTIPKGEYQVLEALKARALGLETQVRKSELLRAGIQVLDAMSDRAFLKALGAVPTLKTGRPRAG